MSILGLDRTFLDFSSKMAEPFCWTWGLLRYRLVAPLHPKKFDHCTTLIREIAFRALIATGACFGVYLCSVAPIWTLGSVVVLGLGSRLFRTIGFGLQKGGYTHVRGTAPEKLLTTDAKVMTWNICGIGAGMHFDRGGVIDWRARLDKIIDKILNENSDVLVLQEVYDTALAEAIVARLGSHYAHFFMHLGPNSWGSTGGCMVLSKCAIHSFSHVSFNNNDWTLNRGFAKFEIKAKPTDRRPCARIIGTHLIHGADQRRRSEQFTQIVDSIKKEKLSLPTLLAGDLNTERDKKEGKPLAAFLKHGYRAQQPTCTSRLTAQWDPSLAAADETIDYISLFKRVLYKRERLPVVDENIRMKNCHLVKAFDISYNTKDAISDHHGVVVTLQGFSKNFCL